MEELRWMRAAIRLYARGDVGAWTDQEVVETFATMRDRPVPYSVWAARMQIVQEQAPQDEDGAEALVAVAKATATNLKVEVQQNG